VLTARRHELAQAGQLRRKLDDFAQRVLAGLDALDFDQQQTLLRLVVEEVEVSGWRVKIRLRIPLDDPPAELMRPAPGPLRPAPSSEDRLRSVGKPRRRLLPPARPPGPLRTRGRLRPPPVASIRRPGVHGAVGARRGGRRGCGGGRFCPSGEPVMGMDLGVEQGVRADQRRHVGAAELIVRQV
jgi:hypothetical protein